MPQFNQSGFGQNEFGSPYLTPGFLQATGTATASISGVVRRRIYTLSATGLASAVTGVRRIRRVVGLASVSYATAALSTVRRRKPISGLAAVGTASSILTANPIRRRRVFGLAAAGISTAHTGYLRTFRRGPHAQGVATAYCAGRKLELPPPVTTGLRMAPWTRPVFAANLRFTRWTGPV